jgi:hypothetical protein
LVKYDGDVLQQYADQLYGKARRSIILHVVFGGFLGGVMGYLTFLVTVAWMFRSSNAPPYDEAGQGVITGLLIGAAISWMIGAAKAFKYKLLAQTTLCYMQIERNTRKGDS